MPAKLTLAQYTLISQHCANHLTQQGRRSQVSGITRLRGEGGAVCPIGSLLTNDSYHPHLEGIAADTRFIVDAVQRSLELPAADGDDPVLGALLFQWQSYHDSITWTPAYNKRIALGYMDYLQGVDGNSPQDLHESLVANFLVGATTPAPTTFQ